MKLVSVVFLTVTFTVEAVQDYISFQPQYQTPNARIFSSENSVYSTPESSTPVPYFAIKNNNNNKLPFPYKPTSDVKGVSFSTPFPHFMSSSVFPTLIRDDEQDDENESKRLLPTPQFLRNKIDPNLRNKINMTENNAENQIREKTDRTLFAQKTNMQQPIDRIDKKLLNQFTMNNGPTTPYSVIYTPTARSMIISTDTNNDQFKPDNYQSYMNFQVPKFYMTPTTETAIPILRLSNEMDLDGSFSYEALGADQTHYVQHSRVENFGSDNQEQIVEGSYSYVGDNGQTYTVNYTADSNGFRASGDHLPVAPPIPEIIQRSIQYNLAKELKMPVEVQSEEKDTEPMGKEKLNFFTHSTQNLFTGRTPESFSFNFPGYNVHNNLIPSASTQAPMKANMEFMKDKPIANISPQITFLASQGAHVPSFNAADQTVSRYNSIDKPSMLQLINYEAPVKDNEQEENKSLWRWQYGLNTESNHNPEKNTISRSYGEDDDIMINFNDMTPDQYANMMRSQLETNHGNSDNRNDLYEQKNKKDLYESLNKNQYPFMNQNFHFASDNKEKEQTSSTETAINSTDHDNWYKKPELIDITKYQKTNDATDYYQPEASKTKIITQHEYIPPTHIVTQSYDYDNTFYEPKRIKSLNTDTTSITEINNLTPDKSEKVNYGLWLRKSNIENISVSTTKEPYILTSEATPFRLTNVEMHQNKNGFVPLLNVQTDYTRDKAINQPTTQTVTDILKENIFLKNLFNKRNNEKANESQLKDLNQNELHRKSDIQTREGKISKFIPLQSFPNHEMKSIRRNPVDIANILNYISTKSQFESNRIRPTFKASSDNLANWNEHREHKNRYENESENVPNHNINDNRNHEQDGMRGIIKNYKTLQRNNKDKDTDKMNRILIAPEDYNLPPLGRTGPSVKSYFPPTYV